MEGLFRRRENVEQLRFGGGHLRRIDGLEGIRRQRLRPLVISIW